MKSGPVALFAHRSFLLGVLISLAVFSHVPSRLLSDEPADGKAEHRVVFFTGSGPDSPFWELFIEFMEAASSDLGITIEVNLSHDNRNKMVSEVRRICEADDKPDAIIIHSFKRTGPILLDIANRNKVPVFMVNSGLTGEQEKKVGEPRERLRHWIGVMLPDDFQAGYDLAIALIDEARKDPKRLAPDGRVHVIGLSGVASDTAASEREKGLLKAIGDRSDAVLDQVVQADWIRSRAERRCRVLYRRYPHASVVWAASDDMAAGAINAIEDLGRTPGKEVIIGGIDATLEAIENIEKENPSMFATVGGHFMEGGWVAVLLHDYFKGFDMTRLPRQFDSPMTLVTRENLDMFESLLNEDLWELADFRQLSRVDSKKPHQFGPEIFLSLARPKDLPPKGADSGEDSKPDDAPAE